MSNLGRRLDRLENTTTNVRGDIAAIVEAGRIRARSMTPGEQMAERASRLRSMLAKHADKPLRGLASLILEGLQRACAGGLATCP